MGAVETRPHPFLDQMPAMGDRLSIVVSKGTYTVMSRHEAALTPTGSTYVPAGRTYRQQLDKVLDHVWFSARHFMAFYKDYLAEEKGGQVHFVVDGVAYSASASLVEGGGGIMLGYGGRRFTVKLANGRTVTTNDMWNRGTIPAPLRDLMPDNASFEAP